MNNKLKFDQPDQHSIGRAPVVNSGKQIVSCKIMKIYILIMVLNELIMPVSAGSSCKYISKTLYDGGIKDVT
jgi:hypothetical protein